MTRFTETGESDTLRTGQSFEIVLVENPSTGFHWKIVVNGEPVSKITADEFRPGAAVGGQGTHYWQFHTIEPGESSIEMELRRPSNAPAAASQTFNVKVFVTP
jgi:predicted secreted protein